LGKAEAIAQTQFPNAELAGLKPPIRPKILIKYFSTKTVSPANDFLKPLFGWINMPGKPLSNGYTLYTTAKLQDLPSNSQFEGEMGWGKLFEDVGSRDAAVKPPWKGLRRSSKGFSPPKMTLKISNWELLVHWFLWIKQVIFK
jgi:hypothetical protein